MNGTSLAVSGQDQRKGIASKMRITLAVVVVLLVTSPTLHADRQGKSNKHRTTNPRPQVEPSTSRVERLLP